MTDLRTQYERMSALELEDLLEQAVLEPGAKELCKQILDAKLASDPKEREYIYNRRRQRISHTVKQKDTETENVLDALSSLFERMIAGVFRFVAKIPRWIHDTLIEIFPFFEKLVRLLVLAFVWLLLVFAPLFAVIRYASAFGIATYIAYTWTVVALAGSIWGLIRITKRHPLLFRWIRKKPDHST